MVWALAILIATTSKWVYRVDARILRHDASTIYREALLMRVAVLESPQFGQRAVLFCRSYPFGEAIVHRSARLAMAKSLTALPRRTGFTCFTR